MSTTIRPKLMNHMNIVLEDFDRSVGHYEALFDAEFVVDIPYDEWHACLVAFGGLILEFIVPHQFLLNARYGPHYVGLEYHANVDDVRKAMAERGIRAIRDLGNVVHTDPRDCFGVAFEFYDGHFLDTPWEALGDKPVKPLEYWSDEHPLGLHGLVGYSVVVSDIAAASAFFQSFLNATVVYEVERPNIGGKAIGLQVADDVVEILTPVGDGILARHHYRYGDGVRSTRIGARDLSIVQHHFEARGIALKSGDAEGTLMLAAEDNLGVIFEFVQRSED